MWGNWGRDPRNLISGYSIKLSFWIKEKHLGTSIEKILWSQQSSSSAAAAAAAAAAVATASFVNSQALKDLFRPRPIVSSKVFQVFFIHFVYNSALFLASCFCSFWLHVVANLICIFLVSRQLVLLSTLPKCLLSFCGQKVCEPQFWKLSFRLMSVVFYPFVWGSNFPFRVEEWENQCIMYFYSWRFLDRNWFESVVYNSRYLIKFC